MDFDLSVSLINELLPNIDGNSVLADRLASHGLSNGRILVPAHLFDDEAMEQLWHLAENHDDQALLFQLIGERNVRRASGGTFTVPNLEMLVPVLKEYLSIDAVDGWLYRRNRDGILLPWLIESIEYIPREYDKPSMPYVCIQLLANTIASTTQIDDGVPEQWRSGMTNAILFYQREMGKLSIPELLASKGFYKECPEFREEYEKQYQRFSQFQSFYGKQFLARNFGFMLREGETPLSENLEFFRIPQGTAIKCVNDEEILERRIETHASSGAVIDGTSGQIPIHCYLQMFHLEQHENCWVHVQNLDEYQYRPELKDKLVLPEDHRRLIDILTAHSGMLVDDIIEGKSGGTTILCMGAAGLGKTLTAEVYSEVVGKPLYRVHSGQLGTSAESVEAVLFTILRRAARWDAILLMDEADVYIRRRDNNLEHNAIVSEFLRTLEYFDGLLFLTTNRVDDVDDAILSRCIAVIRYEVPPRKDAIKLWKSLSQQFQVELSDSLIDDLVRDFPHSTGRDIKELLKLTSRLCSNTNEPVSLEAFHQSSVFRGRRYRIRFPVPYRKKASVMLAFLHGVRWGTVRRLRQGFSFFYRRSLSEFVPGFFV